jgi:hypothetical protein
VGGRETRDQVLLVSLAGDSGGVDCRGSMIEREGTKSPDPGRVGVESFGTDDRVGEHG